MTIAQLHSADHVGDPDSPVRLYCKQEGDPSNTPIFLVHGDAANKLIPQFLSDDIPFYAFYHMRFDGRNLCYLNVTQIAALYVARIREIQPSGPYFLSGYSLGGMIAYEMAHQLGEMGEEVCRLVFIDSKSHTLEGPKKYHNQQFKWTESRLTRLPRKVWKKAVVKICTKFKLPIPNSQRPFYLMEQYRRGRREYRPDIYDGSVLLIRSTIDNFPDRQLGWQGFFRGEINIVDIETDHHSLTRVPAIAEVASIIEQAYRNK